MIYVVRYSDGEPYVATASKDVAEECCREGEYIEEFDVDMRQ